MITQPKWSRVLFPAWIAAVDLIVRERYSITSPNRGEE